MLKQASPEGPPFERVEDAGGGGGYMHTIQDT